MQYHEDPGFHQLLGSIESSLAEGRREEALAQTLELQDMASALGDLTALAAAHAYLGALEFHLGNLERSTALLKKALSIGLTHDSPSAPYYNMYAYVALADVYTKKGEFYEALGNCLNAYHIAGAHPEFRYECILLYRVGSLFLWLDEGEMALGYLSNSYDLYVERGMEDRDLLAHIVRGTVEAYSCTGEYGAAKRWALHKQVDWTDGERTALGCVLLANEVQRCHAEGDLPAATAALTRFLDAMKEEEDFLFLFRSCLNVGRVSLALGDQVLAGRVMDRLAVLDKCASNEAFRFPYAALRVDYYRQFLAPETFSPADTYYDLYYRESLRAIGCLKGNYLSSLLLELEVDKLKYANNSVLRRSFQLKQDLELDPLTGLLNRASAEKYVKERMAARQDGEQQGMFLITIADFKRLNDLYGHHFGDVLLLEIADILTDGAASDTIVSRFGGGEFLVFLSHARGEEFIRGRIRRLNEQGAQIALPDDQVDRVNFQIGGALIDRPLTFTQALEQVMASLA